MLEITVISGKGGAGKTSITAAFAKLARGHVVCDLDVDAPDLHLLLNPHVVEETPFFAGQEAVIDTDACGQCGVCMERCRFDAIGVVDEQYVIDPHACEGCGVCAHFCPLDAVTMQTRRAGTWYKSTSDAAPMIHAAMVPGAENSGLLVSTLRCAARAECERIGGELVLADGPPGIGCPVISAISGTDFVVLVTEPTVSGVHDLARAADLCGHFNRPAGVVINKAGLDPDRERDIAALCDARGLAYLAAIPYETVVVEALMSVKTMADLGDHPVAAAVRSAWDAVCDQTRDLDRTPRAATG